MTQLHTNCVPKNRSLDGVETANMKTDYLQIFFCDVGEDVPRVKGLLDEAVVVLREAQTIQRLIEIRSSHNDEFQVGTVVGRYFSWLIALTRFLD